MDSSNSYPAKVVGWENNLLLVETIGATACNLNGEFVGISFEAFVEPKNIHPSDEIGLTRFYPEKFEAGGIYSNVPGHLERIDGKWHFWAYPIYEK